MFLTGYLQPPTAPVQLLGFHLHGFYMFLTGSLSFNYFVFTYFLQAPFFSFTWFLYVSYRPPFFIDMIFTCFLQAPFFHLHGFYRVTNITFPDFYSIRLNYLHVSYMV